MITWSMLWRHWFFGCIVWTHENVLVTLPDLTRDPIRCYWFRKNKKRLKHESVMFWCIFVSDMHCAKNEVFHNGNP